MLILNVPRTDPFDVQEDGKDNTKVHIRVQQRNGRKCITTVAGLAEDLDVKKITRALTKAFKTSGTVKKDLDDNNIVQVAGDQRTNIRDFLLSQEICHADQILVHGG